MTMPPELDLLPGILMYAYNNGTMVPITEIVTLQPDDIDREQITRYSGDIFPIDQEITATLTLIRYSPWKWNRVLGWKRHTVFKPRKRVFVRLIKQGFTAKGKKVIVL